jgi:hypothetical protein
MNTKINDPELLDEYYESGACDVMSFQTFVSLYEGESRQKIRKPINKVRKEDENE